MDLLPIPPSSKNKVNAALNLANDGGSKSNTGYMQKRGGDSNEEAKEDRLDELTLSTSVSKEVEEDEVENKIKNFFKAIGEFFNKLKEFFMKPFGSNEIQVENIYEGNHTESL